MLNFNYSIPTKIFGKNQISVLGEQIKIWIKGIAYLWWRKYKKNGVYDKVIKILKSNNIGFVELSGIDPNPRVTSVRAGVKLCKENNIDFILAVGGGSTIDCSKVIAASYYYEGDPWDIVIKKLK